MPKPELLPCQECKGENAEVVLSLNNSRYFVYCPDCHARTGALHKTKADAANAWNRRAPGWTRIEQCPEEWKDGRLCVLKLVNSSTLLARFKHSEFYEASIWEDTTGRAIFNSDFIMPLPAGPEE